MLTSSPLSVSRSVCWSQSGHAVPPCLLPRHKRHQGPLQDVRRAPEVSMSVTPVHVLRYLRQVFDLLLLCVFIRRPSSLKNCSTDACALQWRVGPWMPCTATCGRHGFQSRQVTCAHLRTGKATREHHCMWRPRPASWQRCNILSCGRGEKMKLLLSRGRQMEVKTS